MLQLKSFGPAFGQPDASPFVVKAMCLLTMANAEWENHPGSDPRKAPYKKFPALQAGEAMIADSEAIRFFLEDKYSVDFDELLDVEQRGQSRALVRMVEEHLYFCGLRDRWMNDSTWAQMKSIFFDDLPPVIGPFIANQVRKSIIKDVKSQGIGRFKYHEMVQRAAYDLTAIEQVLGQQSFMFGDKPSAADASVGSVLAAIAASPTDTALKQAVLSRPALVSYLKNISATIYPKN